MYTIVGITTTAKYFQQCNVLNSLRFVNVIWENLSHGAKLTFWVICIMWKFDSALSSTLYLDLLWYCYQKLLMLKGYKNKEKHKNYDADFLCFAVSPFATCDGFSQITSNLYTEFWYIGLLFYSCIFVCTKVKLMNTIL